MIEFLLLLIAHLLVDFYLQPTSWVNDKRNKSFKSRFLYFHAGLIALVSYILLGHWDNPIPALVLGIVHGSIDVLKIEFDKKGTLTWFVADQLLHVASILLTVLLINDNMVPGFAFFKDWMYNRKTLAILSGGLLCLSPISFLVGILTKPWQKELQSMAPGADDNLPNAGRWIGMSERILIFVFVLLSQYSAIGFLIAAKSLLRYNDKAVDLPPAYISKKSEYVLVGTLMSYTFAITVALLARTCY